MATIDDVNDIISIGHFQPNEKQIPMWRNKSPVMFLGGSAGGGKSKLAAEKMHGLLLHYGGATGVISRKAEDDMLTSTIPLMLEEVIRIEQEPRCNFSARANRVKYSNGSELIFKGIWDERAREGLKSIGKDGSVDFWWVEEGSEFEEEDFNAILARMRGTAAGWTQIMVTSNPLGKLHWINRRLIINEEAAFYATHASDNPYNPVSYVGMLDRLTGIDRARLRDGLWIDGIGLVIDTWLDDYSKSKDTNDIHGNVTPLAEYIPDYGSVFWFCDDGYGGTRDEKTGWFTARSNPRVFLLGQRRKDGILSIFANHYEIQILQDPHIQKIKDLSESNGWPLPNYSVYDGASPSLGGHLMKAKCKPVGIRVQIDEGVKELRSWVGSDYNGVRKVLVHPRCGMLRFEMGSYTYDKWGNPIDAHNHGIDALRYGVWHEAYSGPGHVEVAHTGGKDIKIDMQSIDERIAEVMVELGRKYANATN